MPFLDRPYPTSYQELCAAYPRFYLSILEMQEILKAQGHGLDDLADGAEQMISNGFVRTADEATVARWEATIGITHTSDALTLDQRKSVIVAKLSGHRHIGAPEIRDIIAPLIDGEISIALVGGTISVSVTQEGAGARAYQDARQTLEPLIPAHLAFELGVKIIRQAEHHLFAGVGIMERRHIKIGCNAPK